MTLQIKKRFGTKLFIDGMATLFIGRTQTSNLNEENDLGKQKPLIEVIRISFTQNMSLLLNGWE